MAGEKHPLMGCFFGKKGFVIKIAIKKTFLAIKKTF